MNKSTKKTKSSKIPKPKKIKKEKTEEDRSLHSMTHYVDDRLELVKQIFGTLKPKTITNLAPDFLKKKNLAAIEELCLNELLGISSKRLLSIINASKCPSDTESSSDSDVHNIEEHVSLEEISSDSEIGGSSVKTTRKKINGTAGASKKDIKNASDKNKNDEQISVLELLELQARARAIRSQLALEPVTKIEVDSDNEDNDVASNGSKESRNSNRKKQRKRKSNNESMTTFQPTKDSSTMALTLSKKSKGNGSASNILTAETGMDIQNQPSEATQKIKLKRNFRSVRENSESEKKPNAVLVAGILHIKEVKEEKKSRSPSPDVIPIISEPITLMISDSSDEDNVVEGVTALAEQIETIRQNDEQIQKVYQDPETTSNSVKERKMTEPEDGEICEDAAIYTIGESASKSNESIASKSKNDMMKETIIEKTDIDNENKNQLGMEPITDQNEAEKFLIDDKSQHNKPELEKHIALTVKANENKEQNKKCEEGSLEFSELKILEPAEDDDDNQNDDVISIEGGDLESEMTEHLEEDSYNTLEKDETKEKTVVLQVEDDIISLDSSEDELIKDSAESWNSRWLKSSKVSKVLAASRLGKRVRDKIKKTKRTKKESMHKVAEADEANKANGSSYTSKYEDGSIEQYKELFEVRQRKT